MIWVLTQSVIFQDPHRDNRRPLIWFRYVHWYGPVLEARKGGMFVIKHCKIGKKEFSFLYQLKGSSVLVKLLQKKSWRRLRVALALSGERAARRSLSDTLDGLSVGSERLVKVINLSKEPIRLQFRRLMAARCCTARAGPSAERVVAFMHRDERKTSGATSALSAIRWKVAYSSKVTQLLLSERQEQFYTPYARQSHYFGISFSLRSSENHLNFVQDNTDSSGHFVFCPFPNPSRQILLWVSLWRQYPRFSVTQCVVKGDVSDEMGGNAPHQPAELNLYCSPRRGGGPWRFLHYWSFAITFR